jgi:hypothetical protein
VPEELRRKAHHAWRLARHRIERGHRGHVHPCNWSFEELTECCLAPVAALVHGVCLGLELKTLQAGIDIGEIERTRRQLFWDYLNETWASGDGVPLPFDFVRDGLGLPHSSAARVVRPEIDAYLLVSAVNIGIEAELRLIAQLLMVQAESDRIASSVSVPVEGAAEINPLSAGALAKVNSSEISSSTTVHERIRSGPARKVTTEDSELYDHWIEELHTWPDCEKATVDDFIAALDLQEEVVRRTYFYNFLRNLVNRATPKGRRLVAAFNQLKTPAGFEAFAQRVQARKRKRAEATNI